MINFKNKKILVTGATGVVQDNHQLKNLFPQKEMYQQQEQKVEKLDLLKKDFPNIKCFKI